MWTAEEKAMAYFDLLAHAIDLVTDGAWSLFEFAELKL